MPNDHDQTAGPDELTEESYLQAVERSKTDKRLADGLKRYELLSLEVQQRHSAYLDAVKEFQETEREIARYMRVREV